MEQGEAILDGLKREIFEESGIIAEPECVTGIYQNLAFKQGFGPLEGMKLPATVNMVFRCRYAGGEETGSGRDGPVQAIGRQTPAAICRPPLHDGALLQ